MDGARKKRWATPIGADEAQNRTMKEAKAATVPKTLRRQIVAEGFLAGKRKPSQNTLQVFVAARSSL